jgi:hypothetical protein
VARAPLSSRRYTCLSACLVPDHLALSLSCVGFLLASARFGRSLGQSKAVGPAQMLKSPVRALDSSATM